MNIQISNLDQTITKDELINLFQQHGEVSTADIATDVFTGQPRGFAIIEMQNDADAQNAINELNNREWNNRVLTVKEAEPATQKGSYRIGNNIQNTYGFQRNMGYQKRKGSKRR